MGRRGYPPEFRRRALDLIDAGRKSGTLRETSGSASKRSTFGASSIGSTRVSSPVCPAASALNSPPLDGGSSNWRRSSRSRVGPLSS